MVKRKIQTQTQIIYIKKKKIGRGKGTNKSIKSGPTKFKTGHIVGKKKKSHE